MCIFSLFVWVAQYSNSLYSILLSAQLACLAKLLQEIEMIG